MHFILNVLWKESALAFQSTKSFIFSLPIRPTRPIWWITRKIVLVLIQFITFFRWRSSKLVTFTMIQIGWLNDGKVLMGISSCSSTLSISLWIPCKTSRAHAFCLMIRHSANCTLATVSVWRTWILAALIDTRHFERAVEVKNTLWATVWRSTCLVDE